MTETPILDAPAYAHGFVTGRYLTAVADGPDADRLMDFTPAKGKVFFTPETVIRRHEGPAPALVVQQAVECMLDDQGYLTSPGGGRGVGLIAGIYAVRFKVEGAAVPGPQRIEVKPSHTEDAPLDLVLAMPEVVPPGSVVVVDETTAQRAEAAAARAEAFVADAESIVANIEAEVRAVVRSSPELKGDAGDDGVSIVDVTAVDGVATVSLSDGTTRLIPLPPGEAGRTPVLTWEGSRLLVDGVPGPDLRGPAGKDGRDGVDGAPGSITDSGWRSLPCIKKSDSDPNVSNMTCRVRITAAAVHVEITVTCSASVGWQLWAVDDAWAQTNIFVPGASGTLGRKDSFHIGNATYWGVRPESSPQKISVGPGSSNVLSAGTWVLRGTFPPPVVMPSPWPGSAA